jgi:hypothetical protein
MQGEPAGPCRAAGIVQPLRRSGRHRLQLRVVMQVSGTRTIPPEEVIFLEWQNSADPTGDGRSEDLPAGEGDQSQ